MPYIPHTQADKTSMLKTIASPDIEALFDEIPPALICDELTAIPAGLNEMAMMQLANTLASKNTSKTCFIGAGSYDHHIPAAVWDIASRGEYLTAYTPYQAEASQGSLQLIYEYQTMIAELTGMEVANASLYDGASALAEAVLMAIRINQRSQGRRVLVPDTLHPLYRQTIETITKTQQVELVTIPFNLTSGTIDPNTLADFNKQDFSALIIPQPNFFGCLEAVDTLCDWAEEQQVITIACVNPTALALLKPPGQWGRDGVDIVCGEGQPLGAPMAYGGPYFGFFSTRLKHVRQMPGRLVGRTVDSNGNIGYTLTLQAREQHIRRGKATSNICTNQGLLVTAATIYLSLLGSNGLKNIALTCHQNTQALLTKLTDIEGVEAVFDAPFFHEVLIKTNKPIQTVLTALEAAGIAGGYPVEKHFPNLKNALLICATEMRTTDDLTRYTEILQHVLFS